MKAFCLLQHPLIQTLIKTLFDPGVEFLPGTECPQHQEFIREILLRGIGTVQKSLIRDPLKEFDPAKTLEYVDDVIGNKAVYVEKLAKKEAELEKMAHRNEKYLAKLLERVKK